MASRNRSPGNSVGVAGSNGQVQFNDNGQLGGDSTFTYAKSTDTLTLAKAVMTIGADVAIAATTMSGTITLTTSSPRYQSLDPDGSARQVDLPAEAAGLAFYIVNRGNGAETITVKNDTPATVDTIDNDEGATFVCDGTRWISSKGAVTIV